MSHKPATSSRNRIKTVVLTSRENFVWDSMQEIIPWIENAWRSSADEAHSVRVINVDHLRLRNLIPEALGVDNIVLPCFTHRLSRWASFLRREVNPDAKFIFYSHNQATIGFWPYHRWGLGEMLRKSDCFICSCSRDASAMGLSFHGARVEVIPFGLIEDDLVRLNPPQKNPRVVPLVFVGRLAEQKNLHTLLCATQLLKEKLRGFEIRLDLIGGEDRMGSPNMGILPSPYLAELRELCSRLGLESVVQFRGRMERENLRIALSREKHVFVSPSLHSDENFGMAAFRSLATGNQAVLTDWGGHADFKKYFKDRTFLTPVRGSKFGPFVIPSEFATSMADAIDRYDRHVKPGVPEIYSNVAVSSRLKSIASETQRCDKRLLPTGLSKTLSSRREKFLEESPKKCKIFRSYSDPVARRFFESYGMGPASHAVESASPCVRLLPWVKASGCQVISRDPHRGTLVLEKALPEQWVSSGFTYG